MKRSAIMWGLISLIIGLTAFWACDDNDHDDRVIYRSFALVQMDEGASTFTLKTERGNTLTPTNPGSYVSSLTNGEWVIATFYMISGTAPSYSVELLSVQEVTTKPYWVMTTSNVDSVVVKTRDPGVITSAWVVKGATMGYINVKFNTLWFSGKPYVNLVQNNTTVVEGDTVATTVSNPVSGVWTLDFITSYTGAQLLPPQRSYGIVSFTVPLTTLAGLTKININYTNYNRVMVSYPITISTTSSTFSSEMSAESFGDPGVMKLE